MIAPRNFYGPRYSVVLARSPALPDRIWWHYSAISAGHRARALAQVHGCKTTLSDDTRQITVHAGAYYNDEEE